MNALMPPLFCPQHQPLPGYRTNSDAARWLLELVMDPNDTTLYNTTVGVGNQGKRTMAHEAHAAHEAHEAHKHMFVLLVVDVLHVCKNSTKIAWSTSITLCKGSGDFESRSYPSNFC